VVTALNLSSVERLREYGAKLVFALLTLGLLWSSGGGDGELFWSRQALLFLVTAVSVLIWARFSAPQVWSEITSKPSRDEILFSLKWGTGCALLAGGLLTAASLFIPTSPWSSWDFLANYSLTHGPSGILFVLGTSYIAEFFLRGYLSESWGKGSVAFLESVTLAVGLQHFVPFALLLPMIFVFHQIARTRGLRSAALTRCVWTLLTLVIAGLVASPST